PLPSLKAYKDSSVAMMRALVARGHRLSVCYQPDLHIDEGVVKAVCQAISLVPDADLHRNDWWAEEGEPEESALHGFDAVIMRKDPPFDMEYVYATHMLEYAEARGARVFNAGAAIRKHAENIDITEVSEITAPTHVI